MSLFTETPIEAALWTFAVSLQDKLASGLFQTSLFRGCVALFMGCTVGLALFRFARGAADPWTKMALTLCCSLTGLALLGATSDATFRPVSDGGSAWSERSAVGAGGRYGALSSDARGLRYYRLAHESVNGLSAALSAQVASIFGDSVHSASPHLLFQTLRETARHTLDDPQLLATGDKLAESCGRRGAAIASASYASLANQFDLQRENCLALYQQWQSQLESWAQARISSPGSRLTALAEAARNNRVTRALGLDDSEAMKNKLIASAVQDYVQTRAGLSNNNVSNAALGSPDGSLTATSGWVTASRLLSVAGVLNFAVRPFTGTDYEAADARNDIAALYTKVSVFLPAIRGFAKALLALMFLVAAARLCFGSPSLLISWAWCLLLVTAYEPLSTFLYQATVTLTQPPEVVEAMGALKSDPLVLTGAQVMDAYASRVQATYFVLQLGLTALTAAGGLAVFRYQRALGGALGGALVSKAIQVTRHVSSSSRTAAPRAGA
jgi:hypothetical protein